MEILIFIEERRDFWGIFCMDSHGCWIMWSIRVSLNKGGRGSLYALNRGFLDWGWIDILMDGLTKDDLKDGLSMFGDHGSGLPPLYTERWRGTHRSREVLISQFTQTQLRVRTFILSSHLYLEFWTLHEHWKGTVYAYSDDLNNNSKIRKEN